VEQLYFEIFVLINFGFAQSLWQNKLNNSGKIVTGSKAGNFDDRLRIYIPDNLLQIVCFQFSSDFSFCVMFSS
jgi:hypothetical protein